MEIKQRNDNYNEESTIDFKSFMIILLAICAGFLLAIIIFPFWAPNMASSMLGNDPKVFWYLSRATAFVAMGLLWVSMTFGLVITNKMARIWPGGPTAFAIHEYTSLLGLSFVLFHALLLLGDHYININLIQILIPFGNSNYQPFLIGLGQMGLYLWVLIVASYYLRKVIGRKVWRGLHYATFITYLTALVHGLATGSDSGTAFASIFYWFTGGSLLFMCFYRVLVSIISTGTAKSNPIIPPENKAPSQVPIPVIETRHQ